MDGFKKEVAPKETSSQTDNQNHDRPEDPFVVFKRERIAVAEEVNLEAIIQIRQEWLSLGDLEKERRFKVYEEELKDWRKLFSKAKIPKEDKKKK